MALRRCDVPRLGLDMHIGEPLSCRCGGIIVKHDWFATHDEDGKRFRLVMCIACARELLMPYARAEERGELVDS